MTAAPGDQLLQHDKVAAAAGIKPDNAAGKTAGVPLEDSTGLLESSGGQGEAGQGSQAQQQRQAEVLSLRRRGTELEESLTAARTGRAAARARREFMKEEAEQARDYGERLGRETARLDRVVEALPPDEGPSVEKLRRLVATLTEMELQEQTALREGRAREEALRAEIEAFTGGTTGGDGVPGVSTPTAAAAAAAPAAAAATAAAAEVVAPPAGEILPPEGSAGAAGSARQRGRTGGSGSIVLEKSEDDPLALGPTTVEPRETRDDDKPEGSGAAEAASSSSSSGGVVRVPRTAVVVAGKAGVGAGAGAEGKKGGGEPPALAPAPALGGKARLAEGLHRIETAHRAAAAERKHAASRLSRLRLAVARRQREEDAAPSHSELLQYLLRFEELGRHSLERREQLRRCQAERSTLSLTRELLANQARLLETVAGGVEEASQGGKPAREAYMRQMEEIIQGVEESLQNQKRLLDEARSRRQAAEKVQASVREDRKRFLAGTKELADECYRYEALNAHLALMRR